MALLLFTALSPLSSSLPVCSLLSLLQEELCFTVCLQGTFASMDELVDWTKDVNIRKPLIARLDLHRAMRRNSCLQTCLSPHSPSHSPCHSPGAEHLHPHQHSGCLSSHSPGPYLDVCEHLQGAVGGFRSTTPYDKFREPHYGSYDDSALLGSPCRASIPIETTDDINELQTVFINSLQFQHQ